MEGALRARLEQISAAIVLADASDLQGLAKLHTLFEEFVREAAEAPAAVAQAGTALAHLVEKIVLDDVDDPIASWSVISRGVQALQQLVNSARAAGEVSFPPELGVGQSSTSTAAQTSAPALPPMREELPSNVDAGIVAEFLARQPSNVDEIENLLMSIEGGGPDSERDELKRIVHTLKGESALLGFGQVEQICHAAEDLLQRTGGKPDIDRFLEVKDWLAQTFEHLSGRGPAPTNLAAILHALGYQPAEGGPSTSGATGANEVNGGEADHAESAGSSFILSDPSLASDFVNEASEHLDCADQQLLTLESDPKGSEAINAVFRAFHSMKGGAGFVGFTDIGAVAHVAENLLDKARKGQITLAGDVVDLVFEAVDTLKRMVGTVKHSLSTGEPVLPEQNQASLIKRLQQAVDGRPIDRAPRAQQDSATESATERPLEMWRQTVAGGGKAESTPEPSRVATSVAGSAPMQVKETVKVDADRLDRLVDTIGELVIAESMVSQSPEVKDLASSALLRHISQLDKITRELQEMATSLRMVPLRSTFQKMARLVRDLSKKSGKSIDFITSGEESELDKTVVDGISDPLVHMVRNAADHGIEPDARDRTKLGKQECATISLRAFHKGGNIYIELEDDGRGLNKDAILKKAVERGLIREGEALADRDVYNLIFHPGLSTAQKVTEISGRGVGMDVVKKSVEALRGQIEIRSEVGKGTIFTIRLPLTLAIIDGMVVRVGAERYIIPTLSVVRSISPQPEQLATIFGRGEMLSLSEGLIPITRLANLFDITGAGGESMRGLIVIVEDDGQKVGLMVDELLGQQQIVIKNLGGAMERMPGISGSAIMADGRVGLIIDVGGVIRLSESCGRAASGSLPLAA